MLSGGLFGIDDAIVAAVAAPLVGAAAKKIFGGGGQSVMQKESGMPGSEVQSLVSPEQRKNSAGLLMNNFGSRPDLTPENRRSVAGILLGK